MKTHQMFQINEQGVMHLGSGTVAGSKIIELYVSFIPDRSKIVLSSCDL